MSLLILDTAIYSLQVLIFQIIVSPFFSMMHYKCILSKNKEWVLNHSHFLKKYPQPSSMHNYIVGVIFLVTIFCSLLLKSHKIIYIVHILSIGYFLVQHLIYDLIKMRKMNSEIPLPSIRKASIIPRTLNKYLPTYLITIIIILLISSLMGCGYMYFFLEGSDLERIKELVLSLLLMKTLGVGTLLYCLKQKPVVSEVNMDLIYRKFEIFVATVILLSFSAFSLVLFVCYYFDFTYLINSRRFYSYTFTLLPMGVFAWFFINPKIRNFYDSLSN